MPALRKLGREIGKLVLSALTVALLGLGWFCNASDEGKAQLYKLDPNDSVFVGFYPTYTSIVSNRVAIPSKPKHVGSPFGTREFVVINEGGPQIPYDKVRTQIIVLENGVQQWSVGVAGAKNLNVNWVTEEVLKVENWPGPGHSLVLIELINVETGKVLLRSATRLYRPFTYNPKPR